MKSVGKQLQEARLAKNWTPELAARETKIKVDRVRDLEVDDYSNFSSPTYARGFVRTYARSLGLDEYKLLRQLDNKLPEDDNASFGSENGLPYVPEPSQAVHVSSANRTGLYVVLGLGAGVVFVIAIVLLQAYRAGELPRYFAISPSDNVTNSAVPAIVDTEAPAHALPVDANDTTHSVRALPVDPSSLATAPSSSAPVAASVASSAPAPGGSGLTGSTPATVAAAATSEVNTPAADQGGSGDAPKRALPVDPADAVPLTTVAETTPAPTTPPETATSPGTTDIHTTTPPRALPVDPSELAAAETSAPTSPVTAAAPAANSTPTEVPDNAPSPTPDSTSATVPTDLPPTGTDATPAAPPVSAPAVNSEGASAGADTSAGKRLVLTASRDSFVQVTSLDSTDHDVLYASVLREGQSLSFNGRKFSLNVGIPSAIDISLDGVNYGPHSDHASPETFTLESHQP